MRKRLLKGTATCALLCTTLAVLASCGGGVNNGELYTYNTYLSIAPSTWNTHNWETSEESYIQSFTEMGLYDVILNETKDGYTVVSEMAASYPTDALPTMSREEQQEAKEITGVTGNLDEGYIWDIELNQNAKWEDGTPINADDYLKSMELLLSPEYVNYRADSYYASNLVIANAERYNKQGRQTIEPAYSYLDLNNTSQSPAWTTTEAYQGQAEFINLGATNPLFDDIFSGDTTDVTLSSFIAQFQTDDTMPEAVRLACYRIEDAVKGYLLYEHVTSVDTPDVGWEEVEEPNDIEEEQLNEDIDVNVFDTTDIQVRTELFVSEGETTVKTEKYSRSLLIDDLNTILSGTAARFTWVGRRWAYLTLLRVYVYNDDTVEFSEVGIRKMGDYKIRLFLSKKITSLDLRFSLTSNWIVKTDLYEDLTVQYGDALMTSYGSSKVENYMSYGPYKLESFSATSFRIVRNDQWYGYTDGKHEGQYQMDELYTRIITDHSTAMQEFLAGNLDDIELNRSEMSTYGNSSRRTTTLESYTQKISFNSDRPSLLARQGDNKGTNKTILANDTFRKGLSLAVNRNDMASTTTAGSQAFTGLLNGLYITDVEKGEMYRDTAQGKSVYTELYKAEGGDPYADGYTETALSEGDNGFNFNMATKYVAEAIKEELASSENGHLQSGDTITLQLRVYDSTSENTTLLTGFIRSEFTDVINAAVNKLKEEDPTAYGSLNLGFELQVITDQDYYNTAKTGRYDMIFSIWGGAATNPYNLMQVYADSEFTNCCEYGFKGKQDEVYLEIDVNENGTIEASTERRTYKDWYEYLNGNTLVEPEGERDANGDFVDPELQAEYEKVHKEKLNILAGLELGILGRFEAVPLLAQGTSSLTSFKVENGTNTYINLVGYGGIRFMTFNYNNAQWAKAVSEAGGDLSSSYRQ